VSLRIEEYVRVATAVVRLATGNTSRVKWFQGIGECVIDWGPGYRVYLAKDGEELIILYGGGTKRRQPADIARAKELHAEYKARKLAASQRRRR
jgi:putative addiction module killer protein